MLDKLFQVVGIEGGPAAVGTVRVELREQYGKVLAYPLCANAKALASISRRKTLTQKVLMHAQAMGFSVIASQARMLTIDEVGGGVRR